MTTVEIYLHDLTPEKQKEILEASGCGPDDNWEICPLAIVEYEN
jgi:hypothetical protein